MITNVADLPADLRLEVARKISDLSHQPNSSLLPKSIEDAMQIIASGIMLAKMNQHQPLFIVAFEPTGDPYFTEVGITCNLAPTQIRGRHAFPEIIDSYRGINGNGKNVLYLTTTDIRMIHVAGRSGFRRTTNPHDFFPPTVLEFCCSPCMPEKTGVVCHGQQKHRCPRFTGDFLPQFGEDCTHQPCHIFTQIM